MLLWEVLVSTVFDGERLACGLRVRTANDQEGREGCGAADRHGGQSLLFYTAQRDR